MVVETWMLQISAGQGGVTAPGMTESIITYA